MPKRHYRSVLAVLLGVLTCMVFQTGLALAEEEKFPDRFMLRLGGYHVKNADTIARLDANNLPVGAFMTFIRPWAVIRQPRLEGWTGSTVSMIITVLDCPGTPSGSRERGS